MIFITLGSQKFQFNRLLIEVDRLIETQIITEEVFAQVGWSDYKPKNYKYKKFLDREDFANFMKKCDKVITHGGTGAIITAIKSNKKVIAVARLSEFNEHVDNHQLQIVNQFDSMNFIFKCNDIKCLEKCLQELEKTEFKKYISNTENIIDSINSFLKELR